MSDKTHDEWHAKHDPTPEQQAESKAALEAFEKQEPLPLSASLLAAGRWDVHIAAAEVEALRVTRWHATRDAALTGSMSAGKLTTEACVVDATWTATVTHGPLKPQEDT